MEIMEEYIDEDILQWWGLKPGGGDPITTSWIGVSTVVTPLTWIFSYLIFVNLCGISPKPLKNVNVRGYLIAYNFFQVMFSAYIFYETIVTAFKASYNIMCEPLHNTLSENGWRMATASWMFYMSKYLDLLDTVFMIVKGNTRQISTLHVFHHSSMIMNSWFGIRHVPTGHSFFIHLSNSFVHMVMYSYYLLSSFGPWIRPYLWWKPYLTQVQIVQFVLMWIHVAVGLLTGCDYPRCLIYLVMVYLFILIILFSNFYIRNYWNNEPRNNGAAIPYANRTETPQQNGLKNGVVQNGVLANSATPRQNGVLFNSERPYRNGVLNNSVQTHENGIIKNFEKLLQNGSLTESANPLPNGIQKNSQTPHENGILKNSQTMHANGLLKNSQTPHENGFLKNSQTPAENGFLKNLEKSHQNGFLKNYKTPQENGFLKNSKTPQENGFLKNSQTPHENGFLKNLGKSHQNGILKNSDNSQSNGFLRNSENLQQNSEKPKENGVVKNFVKSEENEYEKKKKS